MPKQTPLILLAILLVALPSKAQEGGLAVLRIGLDAAAAGMADSHVAHSRDAYAVYWNPAGLAAAEANSAALAYHVWLADLQTYAAAGRFQAGENGGIGLFVVTQGERDLESRTQPGEPDGFFSAQYVSTGIAYGRRLGPVRAGVTAKYLSERIFTDRANGYAFDFGVQADVFSSSVQLGAALQHLGKMSELNAEATELPTTLRVGAAVFPFRIFSADEASILTTMLTAEVVHLLDTDSPATEATEVHVGLAARLVDLIVVRGGYLSNNTLRRFTFGSGLIYEGIRFDYAFTPFESGFQGAGHILTLTYNW